ncbi:MAG: rhodanese-like domain-containing protein [Bacilli bacterium]|nr:rhodanese-like domain-containing protein [Bacilli bacterium]
MKRIHVKDYNPSMGKLIDVQDPLSYKESHHPHSTNVYYDKLLMNHRALLKKGERYFIICKKGHKSKKAVSILEFYGYDVTQVYCD